MVQGRPRQVQLRSQPTWLEQQPLVLQQAGRDHALQPAAHPLHILRVLQKAGHSDKGGAQLMAMRLCGEQGCMPSLGRARPGG